MGLERRLLWLVAVSALLIATSGAGAFGQSADFQRGDANADGLFDISDPIAILGFLFLASPATLPCGDAADANDDGNLDISDAVFSLSFLFLGGPPPPRPGNLCGPDITPDALDCRAFPPCDEPPDPGVDDPDDRDSPAPVVFRGLRHFPLGGGSLELREDRLITDSGPSQDGGFSVELGAALSLQIAWEEPEVPPTPGAQPALVITAEGEVGGTRDRPLGVLEMTFSEAGIEVAVDYTPAGFSSHRVEVYLAGSLLSTFQGEPGAVTTAARAPAGVTAFGGGDAESPGFYLIWPEPVDVVVPGGSTLSADGLGIFAEDSEESLGDLCRLLLELRNIPSLSVRDEMVSREPIPDDSFREEPVLPIPLPEGLIEQAISDCESLAALRTTLPHVRDALLLARTSLDEALVSMGEGQLDAVFDSLRESVRILDEVLQDEEAVLGIIHTVLEAASQLARDSLSEARRFEGFDSRLDESIAAADTALSQGVDAARAGNFLAAIDSYISARKMAWRAIGLSHLTQSLAGTYDEIGDQFGWSLAAGNFNGDDYEDLAVGVPWEDLNDIEDSGRVIVFYGTAAGLTAAGSEHFTQSTSGANNEDDDFFGWSLAAGNFDGDSFDDLAVGVPWEDTNDYTNTGRVVIFYGSGQGLLPADTEGFTSLSGGVNNGNGDKFGYSLAVGNFDGNIYDDLVVGMPYDNPGGNKDAGRVMVFYGSGYGLLPATTEVLTQTLTGGRNEPENVFGFSIVTGDFDGDLNDDLAVGLPRDDLSGAENAGSVIIFFGNGSGLLPANTRTLTQTPLVPTTNEQHDQFGYSLAAGDFDADTIDDLVVGAPFKETGTDHHSGRVVVVLGDNQADYPKGAQFLGQSFAHAQSEWADKFGMSLAVGDFDGDSHDDLAVGSCYEDLFGRKGDFSYDDDDVLGAPSPIPYEDYSERDDSGAVMVFFGGPDGVWPFRSYWTSQNYFGKTEESDDIFAYSLASGDFDNDGVANLAVGSPGEDLGEIQDAGCVLTREVEPALPDITAKAAIVIAWDTGKVLGIKFPDKPRAMASTTKMITALMTIELINDGVVSASDEATVSFFADADTLGGSTAGLQVGDHIELLDLLYGLMLPSGNDCAVAIAEFITGQQGPPAIEEFASLMNIRAAELGLDSSRFQNPYGRDPERLVGECFDNMFDVPECAHYSTARDLARLARYALNEPLFETIVGTPGYLLHSLTDSDDTPKNICVCNTNAFVRDGSAVDCRTGSCSSSGFHDSRVRGVKTGTTDLARACLVTCASDACSSIITVVLGSYMDDETTQRYQDSEKLIEFGFGTCP